MFLDVIANVTIVASFLFLIGQIYKSHNFDFKQTTRDQFALGCIFGLLGIVLMFYSIHVTNTVIVDLRNLSVISAGMLGGPLAALIASLAVAVFRVVLYGINAASILAQVVAVVLGVGCALLSGSKLTKIKKFVYMVAYAMLISSAALVYLIQEQHVLVETLVYYWLFYLVGALLTYFTCEYIVSANAIFKTMNYYRITAENLLDMISTHEPDGTTIFVSPSIIQICGYTPEEYVGTSPYDHVHPDDISALKESHIDLLNGMDTSTVIYRTRRKDGNYTLVETLTRNVRNKDGSTREMICVTRDISHRKEIEQELRVTNARFKAIFDNAGIGIVLRDQKGKLIEANNAYLEMLGCTKEEAANINDIICGEDKDKISQRYRSLYTGYCSAYREEVRYLNKQQQIVYTDATSTMIPGTAEMPLSIISVVNNITERKGMEEIIRQSEERFRAAFNNAAIGMCLASLQGMFLRANRVLCDLLGYSEAELISMNFRQITHPDDLDMDISLMKQLLAGEIPYFHLEKRYFHKDGRIIWALLGVSIVYDRECKPEYLIGQVQDITLRKQTEDELKRAKSEAELLASTDYLTGILNRRAFVERFNEEFNRVGREKSSISLIMADIDHFKKINDTYGHHAGDAALKNFSRCLSQACRPYDFMGRLGGEEFIICLPKTDNEQAKKIAERIRKAVEGLVIIIDDVREPIKITASFGVASPILGNEESIDTLITQADRAMYLAKIRGRNRVCTIDQGE